MNGSNRKLLCTFFLADEPTSYTGEQNQQFHNRRKDLEEEYQTFYPTTKTLGKSREKI
jgi:hypothetical protein